MNAPKTQEQILEEKRNLCAARRRELSSVRMSKSQIDKIAEDALDTQLAAIQEKIGVLTGDFAAQYFSDNKQKNALVQYIKGEKNNTFRDLLEPINDEELNMHWAMLNKLVLMQVKGKTEPEPIVLVGRCSDVIEAALAHYKIEFESDNDSTVVWKRGEDLSINPIYTLTSEIPAGNSWTPKARVLLLEAAIIHAISDENDVIWQQLSEKAPESRAVTDFMLESKSGFIEHTLGQHNDNLSNDDAEAGNTACYVNLNALQAMMDRVQDAITSDLARLESVEESALPYIEERNGRKIIPIGKLSCYQKVHAIQSAMGSGKLTFVGDAQKLIKAETAGDENTFLFVAAQNAQKLNPPPVVPEQFASSQPTVHLDW